MPKALLVVAVLVLVVVVAGSARVAAAGDVSAPRVTLANFAGYWSGHTRGLNITRGGYARESIDDGCCRRVIRIAYRLARPRGTSSDATVRIRVLDVRLYNKALYWKTLPRPHVNQVGRFHLKAHVITDSITDTIFCAPEARPIGRCGA